MMLLYWSWFSHIYFSFLPHLSWCPKSTEVIPKQQRKFIYLLINITTRPWTFHDHPLKTGPKQLRSTRHESSFSWNHDPALQLIVVFNILVFTDWFTDSPFSLVPWFPVDRTLFAYKHFLNRLLMMISLYKTQYTGLLCRYLSNQYYYNKTIDHQKHHRPQE